MVLREYLIIFPSCDGGLSFCHGLGLSLANNCAFKIIKILAPFGRVVKQLIFSF